MDIVIKTRIRKTKSSVWGVYINSRKEILNSGKLRININDYDDLFLQTYIFIVQ